jgi:hypothetical protein
MDAIARCSYCQQPLGPELSTVHAASDDYHFLCAMLVQQMAQYRPSAAPVAAA